MDPPTGSTTPRAVVQQRHLSRQDLGGRKKGAGFETGVSDSQASCSGPEGFGMQQMDVLDSHRTLTQ